MTKRGKDKECSNKRISVIPGTKRYQTGMKSCVDIRAPELLLEHDPKGMERGLVIVNIYVGKFFSGYCGGQFYLADKTLSAYFQQRIIPGKRLLFLPMGSGPDGKKPPVGRTVESGPDNPGPSGCGCSGDWKNIRAVVAPVDPQGLAPCFAVPPA